VDVPLSPHPVIRSTTPSITAKPRACFIARR
jgi:hypothetical protein